jgi:23S rRNA pseudouridine1911/1915/1917 synthase
MRLDRFLVTRGPFTGLGRRGLAAILASGQVRVNGTTARKGTIVRAGDTITIREAVPGRETPIAVPLTVVYADPRMVAIDKPPDLPTTTGRTPGPSVAATLLSRYPEMAALSDARHAGLVHRLDTGTSGLLLAARDPETHTRLRTAFTHKHVVKDYLAVVAGRLAEPRCLTQALTRHPRSRGRMIVARDAHDGWAATTEIVPIQGDDALTVVRLRMRTGVTHQLRVHLATLGHPIVGDRRYGRKPCDDSALGVPLPPWHYLHAWTIACDDPGLFPWIATPFPAHWRALFTLRSWSIPTD